MDISLLHQDMIYPVVRVRTGSSGGSGSVIFSQRDTEAGDTNTFIITNHHVIDAAVKFANKWDGTVARDIKTEIRAPVDIDIFRYHRTSWEEGIQTVQADIVAWDQVFDLALLQLRSSEVYSNVAKLYPKDLVKELRIGMETLTVGCSLGHKPIPSQIGFITSLDETIENQRWWMHSSPAVFGNSGGACYILDRRELFGITARIAVVMIGWGGSPITWLQYVIPVTRVYNWLEEICYDFIFNPSKSIEECQKARENKMDVLKQAWEARFRSERAIATGEPKPLEDESGNK